MTFPDGESVDGAWDIRGQFNQYIGNYPLQGKTVLDVGTASGFLALEAERAGARVTALDARHAGEFNRLPFGDSLYHLDRAAHVAQTEAWLTMLKSGFWYSWHRFGSGAEMVYAPLAELPYWERRFDVVIAGALLEHLADPVSTIGSLAALAKEAVIIAFTPIADSAGQFMETATAWSNPEDSFTFWTLSRGLYARIFENLGFSIEILPAAARIGESEHVRSTLIARRGAVSGSPPTAADTAHLYVPPTLMRKQLETARRECQEMMAERNELIAERNRANLEREAVRREIAALRGSTSWAVTSPLRRLSAARTAILKPQR